MASEWIKMRVTLRKHPRVIAISRHLSESRAFMNWWGDPQRMTAKENVTELVTFGNVTRCVTCALLELWGVTNGVIKDDEVVPYMSLIDLDDITGLPDFGLALLAVGWVEEVEGNGLRFPNFSEHNTPDAMRTAKTSAERQKAYRDRKKRDEPLQRVTDIREEKSKEEKSKKTTTALDTSCPQELAKYKTAWDEWVSYKKIKHKATLTKLVGKFKELGPNVQAAVDNSIANGYAGLFAPKGGQTAKTNSFSKLTGEQKYGNR